MNAHVRIYKFFKLPLSPDLALLHIKEVFLDMHCSPILPNFRELTSNLGLRIQNSNKVKHPIRNKPIINSL